MAVAAQGVAVTLAVRGDRHLRAGLELGEVGGHLPGRRLPDHAGRRVADPVELGERVGLDVGVELARCQLPDDVACPHERLGLEARVVRPIEAVNHPVERTHHELPGCPTGSSGGHPPDGTSPWSQVHPAGLNRRR